MRTCMWWRSSSEVEDGEGATLRAAGGKFGRFRPHERGTGLIERSPEHLRAADPHLFPDRRLNGPIPNLGRSEFPRLGRRQY